MRHVILGNGPAGVVASELIRKHAPNDDIVLVGAEPEPSYSRMAIPYLLMGKIDEAGTYLRKNPVHFDLLGIRLKTSRAKSVNARARTVSFDDGTTLSFDRMLIATGSVPLRLAMQGMDLPGVHPCWTLADARKILALAKPGARVLQIGAGFIGCIILEALAARGVRLTVVEMGDRMVPRMMGQGAGGMIKRWVQKKGVAVHTSTRVELIRAGSGGAPLEAHLSDGQRLKVDLVISATGVRPSIEFLQDSGIDCQRGVLTDARTQTSVPGIYAAGDCAEAFDAVTQKPTVSATQPNAVDQASCAALNMVGREAQMSWVTQINVLDTLGLISSSFGQWQGVPGGEHVERSDEEAFKFLRLEFDRDVLVGANAIGLTQHVGVIRGLIQARARLGVWKDRLLRDPTLLGEAFIARTQAQDSWLARVV